MFKLRAAGVSQCLFLVRTEATATSACRTAMGRRDRDGKPFIASTCYPTILSGMCTKSNKKSHFCLRLFFYLGLQAILVAFVVLEISK